MYLSNFWNKFGVDIIISLAFTVVSLGLFVLFLINQSKSGEKKLLAISIIAVALLLLSVNFIVIRDYNNGLKNDSTLKFPLIKTLLFNSLTILLTALIGFLFSKSSMNEEKEFSVQDIAVLGIMVALSSVLMLFGIPIFPHAPFLKVEFSALIYFMVFLWFGFRPTFIVILLTNMVHVIMPSIGGQVLFAVDELVNVIACMAFLTPAIIASKIRSESVPKLKEVIITAIIGTIFTTIFMVMYNQLVNIPLIYKFDWSFKEVLVLFGPFNLIKWGSVGLLVCLFYQRLYPIKELILK